MAYGLPVVASALHHIEIVENGSNGLYCQEWWRVVLFLEKLIIDENLRKKLGWNGRKKWE
jgi:hypothetical protein